jgi:hypothetical protein
MKVGDFFKVCLVRAEFGFVMGLRLACSTEYIVGDSTDNYCVRCFCAVFALFLHCFCTVFALFFALFFAMNLL